jgi:phage anti-repressor protein
MREIIPVANGKLGLEVNSRALHEKLGIQTKYATWIDRQIQEYGFVDGIDFFPKLGRSPMGHTIKEYDITLDMAKELAMVQKNEMGRVIRRYLIEMEKQFRDWMDFILPRMEMDYDLFGGREGYDYLQLLRSIGCSTSKGAVRSRINKHRREFWKSINGHWFVSENYGKTIILYAIARRWSMKQKLNQIEK